MMRHSDGNGLNQPATTARRLSTARRGGCSRVSRRSPHAEGDGAATGTEGVWQVFR